MIATAFNLTPDEVARAIGQPVKAIHAAPWDYHTSHAMQSLRVELGDGTIIPMLLKDLDFENQLPEARRTRPPQLYNPRREIDVYREILNDSRLDAPRCYGAIIDQKRHWLFLEELIDAIPLWQCEMTQWPLAAAWLRRLHEHRHGDFPESLLRYESTFYRFWLDRAAQFHPSLKPIEKNYDQIIARLESLPQTFIHGEFYASNILMQQNRVRPIDWETAAVGPAMVDLAALVSGNLTDKDRAAIIEAYGADTTGLDECRLHLAIQWLGWSRDWTPPPEHAHDWLAEAYMLAKKLGIA